MGRGKDGEQDRIVQAMITVFCGVAPLSGKAKDKKEGLVMETGPPKRPLCNGNIGTNTGIGYLTSMLIKLINKTTNRKQGTSVFSR